MVEYSTAPQKWLRNRQYPAETMTGADYVDDLVFLANTLNQAESLLHNLEQAPRAIGLSMNLDKTEFMSFNQVSAIFSLNGKPLKLKGSPHGVMAKVLDWGHVGTKSMNTVKCVFGTYSPC